MDVVRPVRCVTDLAHASWSLITVKDIDDCWFADDFAFAVATGGIATGVVWPER